MTKEYNIETRETIEVVKASSITVSSGNAIAFHDKNGSIILALNNGEWKRVWAI